MASNSCIDDATRGGAGQTLIVAELANNRHDEAHSSCKSKQLQEEEEEEEEEDEQLEKIAGKEERLQAAPLQPPRPAMMCSSSSSGGGRGGDDSEVSMGAAGGISGAAWAAGSRLRLGPLALALPRYADCPQIAYVLQGGGMVGVVFPGAEEEVVRRVREGHMLGLPAGAVHWWHCNINVPQHHSNLNHHRHGHDVIHDHDPAAAAAALLAPAATHHPYPSSSAQPTSLSVLFLADTSQALKPGQITSFHLVGSAGRSGGASAGIMHGFSKDFVAQAWDMEESRVSTLLGQQSTDDVNHIQINPGTVTAIDGSGCDLHIIKLEAPLDDLMHHEPGDASDLPPLLYGDFIYDCMDAKHDVDVKGGGRVVVITSDNLPVLSHMKLSADLVKLDPGAMCSPGFSADGALQVTYVVRGSGRVQVVDNEGRRVLDAEIRGGFFFVVPPFHVVSKRAGPDGLEWFSIITKEKPIFTHLAGKTGVWKALSSQVLRASFGIGSTELEHEMRSRRTQDAIFFPPTCRRPELQTSQ